MAQAGGLDANKVDEAFEAARGAVAGAAKS